MTAPRRRPTTLARPEPGTWPLAALGPGQCRFACTGHNVPRDAHRFCGEPTAICGRNLHGSWCPIHLEIVRPRTDNLGRPAYLPNGRSVRL